MTRSRDAASPTTSMPWNTSWLVRIMCLAVGCQLVGLLLSSPTITTAAGLLIVSVPSAVCWTAVRRTSFSRPPLILAATAVSCYAAGDLCYAALLYLNGTEAFPSLATVGYLLFYPFMLGTLVMLVRPQLRRLGWSIWLDIALGALGAASVLAVVLSPVLRSAADGPLTLATSVALASPICDVVLVAAVVGIASSHGLDVGRRWLLLVVGLTVFAVTDVIYAVEVTIGTYALGAPTDAGWAVGTALVALWVDDASRVGPSVRGPRASALGVPAAATAAAMAVLILGTRVHTSTLAVVLAGATLLAAVARTQHAFRQLVRMADLRAEARTDDLTGLPNRRALYADVPPRLEADGTYRCALLLLDLDRFKEVNDSLGHHVGDRLLVQVGTRLTQQLAPENLLARLGGDEFAILLDGADRNRAVHVAAALRTVLAEPFTLEGISLRTDVSIGIALFPDQGADLSELLRRADMAMYGAKASRAGHRVFTGTDDTRGDARLRTLEELRHAVVSDELVLHYQPKIDLASGEVLGVESLVRWEHPRQGLLLPDAFLDLVEDAGLMRDLTQRVLALALDQAVAWRARDRPLTVAVNLSATSLTDADLPDQIGAMLAARDLPADLLVLEITEQSLMADRHRATNILTRLRHTGVAIAVDDFGTGYSSLAYLRDLPIDELKLDRSFVFSMADDARAAALVESTIALAHSLDLRMVAEGVEDRATYDELVLYGCDQAQGYYVSRPIPGPELESWLLERDSALALVVAQSRA